MTECKNTSIGTSAKPAESGLGNSCANTGSDSSAPGGLVSIDQPKKRGFFSKLGSGLKVIGQTVVAIALGGLGAESDE